MMSVSDLALQKDVDDELAFDPRLDARSIAVAVCDGTVTLRGSVPSYAEKIEAENAAKRVRGVLGIAEELDLDLPDSCRRTDPDLLSSVLETLRWNADIPHETVFATVEQGWVTLTGSINWHYQREAARLAAASVAGVLGVTNEVRLKAAVASTDVRTRIDDAFRRSAEIEAKGITVDEAGGVVTLRGSVHSWTERENAAIAAYSVAGVSEVKNFTTVTF